MKTALVSVSAVATLGVAVSLFCVERPSPTTPAANAEGTRLLERLPVAFVPNVGQWEHRARYVARIGAMTVFLEENGWTFTLVERTAEKDDASARGVAVRMAFAGASEPELVAEDQLPGRHNYFLGNDASKWRSDVPLYGAVRYREVHPGIDVRARELTGRFEYDLLLQPRADLDPVEIVVEGCDRLHIDKEGALVMETARGPVRMPAPLSWEEGPSGERSVVTCCYVLRGADRFGFEVIGRRPGWALVVDPGLVWSTFLGGKGNDWANAVAVDRQGAATVAGQTSYSSDFPTTPGAFDSSYNGGVDAFVTRLSPTGSSLVYSTFLGGTGDFDDVLGLALDAQGAATVAGYTTSTDFPTTTGAFDTSYNGGERDAFVARLSPSGSSLVYSTFLGGTDYDLASAVALDTQGAATVAGATVSTDFPTTPGAFDTSYNGGGVDGFVTRLSPSGSSLVYSTFLGGTGGDGISGATAVDAQGAVTVAGGTSSTDFPTTPGAFDTSFNGGRADGFVTRLSPSGSSLVYSTFLGGTDDDRLGAAAVDAQGAATVAGATLSTDFPTTPGAFDTSYNGGLTDGFVTRLSPSGSSLVYSTFLGGTGGDGISGALALDAQGAATVAGRTTSTNFPTTPGAFDRTPRGGMFVTRLSPSGSSLVYSTFLGDGWPSALALDAQGAATVGGFAGPNFPTTPGAFDTSHNGGMMFTYETDAFVTRLDMLPTGVTAFGKSSPGCTGPLAISVNSMPYVGNASFALTCGNAPKSTSGLCALTANRFGGATVVLGVELWVDPSSVFVPVTAVSNSIGASEVLLAVPNDPVLPGGRLFAQFMWLGPTSPPPCPRLAWSASNALAIVIWP